MRFVVLLLTLTLGCESSPDTSAAPAGEQRPRSEPVEWVGLSATLGGERVMEVLGPLFGDASRTAPHANFELQPGVFLSSFEDPRTPEQRIVEVTMDTGESRRVILRVPASYGYGQVFIDTASVALARAATVEAEQAGSMDDFDLIYRSRSVMGGELSLQAVFSGGQSRLILATNTPQTSLSSGLVGSPAFSGEPIETLAGTVWFELSRDSFDFFSTRAYGITAGAAQNFNDFLLLPHDWLRLTVTPNLGDEIIDVAFEVVTLDGRRIPFARAPASLLGGEQFRENVFRMVDNMNAQEAAEAGSSMPWQVPFYYDDPEGGGVVRVIAQGQAGVFRIAYSVESPVQRLREVDFVPYQGRIAIPDETPEPETTCADVGSVDALEGRFRVRFDASSTVRESADLAGPLRAAVYGSVFRAEDVTLQGPNDGAEAVARFAFEDVDATVAGAGPEFVLDTTLPRGSYQFLGFMDVNGNGGESRSPDVGDPVTLPIGGFELGCAEQPVVVEFALLLPERG
ncbi:MAG: hypothetical protein AAF938_17250 [Myxococcota bacterium]